MLVFGDFKIHHNYWLYILAEPIDLVNSYNFPVADYLTQMVKFPSQITDGDSHSSAVLNLFISSDANTSSTMAYPSLRNFDVPVLVSIDFPSKSQQNTLFHLIAYDYCCAVCNGLFDHLRDVWWEDTLKLSASAAASDLCEWVQVRIDVYIPHHKYHVKLHSSAAFAATIVHRNHFFPLHQQNKSSESKRKFRQSSSKWFLKLLNLHMLIKEKSL